MKIYLIRHGESTSDIEDRYGGDYDDELTTKGVETANEVAKKLLNAKIKLIYSSPKKRATQTAEIISTKIGARVIVIENLRERNNYGVLTGLTKTEAKEKFPFDVKELEEKAPNHKVKLSEPFEKFRERVIRAFNLVVNESEENIAIITHAGPIRRIVFDKLNKKIKEIGQGTIIEIEENKNEYTLAYSAGVEFE
jgi:broad specificity phosphatase PhoE